MTLQTTLTEVSPFPTGKSPFQLRGNAYRVTLANIDQYVEGGRARVIDALATEDVRAFLRQSFNASSWYDIFPMMSLVVQVARTNQIPYFKAVSELSRMLVEADLNGVYRALLHALSPDFLAPKFPRMQAHYINFGALKQGARRHGYCEVTRTAHPAILAHWYVAMVHGFLPFLLAEAGAKEPRIRWESPVPDGVGHGVELVSMRFVMQWG